MENIEIEKRYIKYIIDIMRPSLTTSIPLIREAHICLYIANMVCLAGSAARLIKANSGGSAAHDTYTADT